MVDIYTEIHNLLNYKKRINFPFTENEIPLNGIYILFEKGEEYNGKQRIVRVGTHSGQDKLFSRLKEHFLIQNKDRSIFRKHIGRALLNKRNDSFAEQWELDLTSRVNKNKFKDKVDFQKQKLVEEEVSKYINEKFSFVTIEVNTKDEREFYEKKLISSLNVINSWRPSDNWLGFYSPNNKISQSGLWNIQNLNSPPFLEKEFEDFKSKFLL